MNCLYFNSCGGCNFVKSYQEQIDFKKSFIKDEFLAFYNENFEFYKTVLPHFRSRAEFKIYHEDDKIFYAMTSLEKKFLKIENCPKVDIKIADLMPILLQNIQTSKELKTKLFGIEFLTSKDEILPILLYHKNIELIKENLEDLSKKLNLNLIVRSYKKKLVFGRNFLNEELKILDKTYFYRFSDSGFIQPNRYMNENMIGWVKQNLNNCKDLLEMYCGFGNFTIALSEKFSRVLATEISKQSISDALLNKELNRVENIDFVRISSEELMQAFNQVRDFERLKDIHLDSFDFSHILVDPPRAGLDESVIKFIKNFENIIYISCNPTTLKENLKELSKTHEVVKFAVFDQFAYSFHTECGVILRKKR